MIKSNTEARQLVACLAFFFVVGPTITATSHSWFAQEVKKSEWSFEEFSNVDQEVLASDTSAQLVQTNKVSSDLSTIQLELINNTYCELSLHDLEGNCIQNIEAEQKKKGKHLVLWKHTDVASGTYLLRLYTNQGYEHVKVVLE